MNWYVRTDVRTPPCASRWRNSASQLFRCTRRLNGNWYFVSPTLDDQLPRYDLDTVG
jgi:hypothetical protein